MAPSTILRTLRTSQTLRTHPISRATKTTTTTTTTRPFTTSPNPLFPETGRSKSDVGTASTDSKHALDKDNSSVQDVQTTNSHAARSERARDAGGAATQQKDPKNKEAQKTKEEFPERPDNIGMQDERGGRGH